MDLSLVSMESRCLRMFFGERHGGINFRSWTQRCSAARPSWENNSYSRLHGTAAHQVNYEQRPRRPEEADSNFERLIWRSTRTREEQRKRKVRLQGKVELEQRKPFLHGDDLSNGQHEGGESEVWDHEEDHYHEESEDWSHEAADEGNRTTEDATRPATESYGRNDSGRSQDTTRLGFMKKGSHYEVSEDPRRLGREAVLREFGKLPRIEYPWRGVVYGDCRFDGATSVEFAEPRGIGIGGRL